MSESFGKFSITYCTYLRGGTCSCSTGSVRKNFKNFCLSFATFTGVKLTTLACTGRLGNNLTVIPYVSLRLSLIRTYRTLIPVTVSIVLNYVISVLCINTGVLVYLSICVDNVKVRSFCSIGNYLLYNTGRSSRFFGNCCINLDYVCIIVFTSKYESC